MTDRAEALAKALEGLLSGCERSVHDGEPHWEIVMPTQYEMEIALDALKAYRSQQACGTADGWISVADQLPQINTEVLIAFRGSSLPATGQYTGSPLDNDGWCYPSENSGDETDWTVTHWQPLPAPPNSKEQQ